MRYSRAATLTLIGSLLLAGCGGLGRTTPAIVAPPAPTQAAAANTLPDARPALGGDAYASFKIAPQLPRASGQRLAVKLTYLMNDDTAHQSPQSLGMLRMLDDLPQKAVHNVVFRDGGEQGDARLYYLSGGDGNTQTIGSPQSTLAPSVTEIQSNNPRVFSQILAYAFDNYQARRHYLQLYTHGGGVFGIGTDEVQTDPAGKPLPQEQSLEIIPVTQFAEAIRQGLKGRQLDMIYFRACLMGNVEALYELRGTTRYAVGSEDVSYSVDNSNLTMTKLFDDMAARDAEPATIARELAIAALAKNPQRKDGSFSGYTTIAAVDIGRMDELKSAISTLAKSLTAALPKHREAIAAAYDAVNVDPAARDDLRPSYMEYGMRDLWMFTAELLKRVNDNSLKQAVDAVRKAQRAAMLHERDAFGSDANGLSIYMPARAELAGQQGFMRNTYAKTRFAQDSAWDEFLVTLSKN